MESLDDRRSVVILTPSVTDPMYSGRWREILSRLETYLAVFNIFVISVPWDTVRKDLSYSGLVILPLLAWGYQRSHSLWLARCKEWEENGLHVLNAPQVLRWNSHKRYLEELRKCGHAIVPSICGETFSYALMVDALAFFGVEKLVVKPAVSATAYKTSLWTAGDVLADPPDGDCIVQPYLDSIVKGGEISLIFIEGTYSHAVRKVPINGDFRVQPEFGGMLAQHHPTSSLLETANKVYAGLNADLLYARIDMIQGENDEWLLLEAELIEPDLFLELSSQASDVFGRALRKRVDAQHAEKRLLS
jgi:glutathione synthase/RimK-type ligase-like ATP-grasp enzyme